MSDTQSDDDLARSQFDDAKRSVDSVERSSGDEGEPEGEDLGLRDNDELTDGDAVR